VSVKSAMSRQNDQNQQVMASLHAGQQRLQSQINDAMTGMGDKYRHLDAAVGKIESAFGLKTNELGRCIEEQVGGLKRHVEANDQAVRLVTDMMGARLAGGGGGGMGEFKISPERGTGMQTHSFE